ncbi:MAG: tRNA (guanosine(46)-N7)-methyltransferase TrmB [Muribaculaceae bacterium]|nr:tRNA (guanosine(46)-N7)-methyltransferase TrmB [Muribaculaceae bacterium]
MGKNKLRKFSEMETIDFVLQYPFAVLKKEGFPLKGNWHKEFFNNDNPIVLELGCGKGEYTVGLARRFPNKNFIGIDIKGARMWSGATQARDEGLKNVAFLRTNIELLPEFFAQGEVAEIWITFPDPQMKKVRKRLTSTRFLELYRQVTNDGALIHLKTDSPFLYTYTHQLVLDNKLPVLTDTDDLYNTTLDEATTDILGIRTYYEQQWLSRGLTIKYINFRLPAEGELIETDIEIPLDTYRSFSRDYLSRLVHEDY